MTRRRSPWPILASPSAAAPVSPRKTGGIFFCAADGGGGGGAAPPLAVADIGIAIGSGSDVAKETGGIILMRDDVREVVAAIRLSRLTLRKIKQNMFWSFIYNSIGVPRAALA